MPVTDCNALWNAVRKRGVEISLGVRGRPATARTHMQIEYRSPQATRSCSGGALWHLAVERLRLA
eukprot:2022075-Prymnesium_polylepis.1